MKSNVEIIGLPLMGIQDGVDCGTVHELIFSIEQKNVQFLVLDYGRGLFGLKVLAFSKITGIGKDVLTAQSSEDVKPLWEDKEAIALNFTGSNILNARAISNEGDIVGRVSEYFVNEKTGAIEQLKLDNGITVPGEDILTLSVGAVFTSGSIAEQMLKRAAPRETPASAPHKDPFMPKEPAAAKGVDPSLSGLFQKRQIEYLIGREVTKDIKGKNGVILAKAGEKVPEELALQVKEEGRMPELTLNVK